MTDRVVEPKRAGKQSRAELVFGLQDGQLRHISEVRRGRDCQCSCPACGVELVAKKGAVVRHHFAHHAGDTCKYAVETALHLAAKDILLSAKEMVLPKVQVEFNPYGKDPILLAPEASYKITDVRLEKSVGKIVPDVIIESLGRKILIEIFVTHKTGSEKIKHIQSLGLSAVEIDLSETPRDLSIRDLELLILSGGAHKRWLHNAASEKRKAVELAKAERMPITRRGPADLIRHVDDCPIAARVWRGKPYANLFQDCLYCPHCLDINELFIRCNGTRRRTT